MWLIFGDVSEKKNQESFIRGTDDGDLRVRIEHLSKVSGKA